MTNQQIKIKEGYKQTEVGVIPEDWEVKKLEDLCAKNGLVRGPFGGALKKEFFVEKGIKVYEQKNAIYRNVELGDYFIDEKKFKELGRFELFPNDFIVSCSGTIGKIYLIPPNAPKGIINQALLKIKTDNSVVSEPYFFYYFDWEKFQEKIIDNTQGGAMKNLVGMSIFRGTKIPLPPTKAEQTAIAAALSDADALIQSMEKLIAKKRLIKQGAMQKLLKPKEGWVVKKLREIAFFTNGKAHEQFIDAAGDYIVVNSKFISTKGEIFKNASISLCPLNIGDITMVMSDIPNGKALAKCFIIPKSGKYTLNQRICALRTETLDTIFLTFVMNRNKYFLAFDSGTGQTNLKKQDVLECPINLPPTKKEQIAIAKVLSDMDAEISALETKLAKYKQIKQGMMVGDAAQNFLRCDVLRPVDRHKIIFLVRNPLQTVHPVMRRGIKSAIAAQHRLVIPTGPSPFGGRHD